MQKKIFLSMIIISGAICAGVFLILALLEGEDLPLYGSVCAAAFAVSAAAIYFVSKKIARPIIKTGEVLRKAAAESSLKNHIEKNSDDIESLEMNATQMRELLNETLEDLHNKNSRLRAILKAVPSALVAVDEQKRLIMLNSVSKELFGIPDNWKGVYFIESVRNVSLEKLIDKAITTRKKVVDERPIITGTESEAFYNITVAPIKSEEGKILGAILLAQDITDIKNVEIMRRDFTANVTHELKSPLTVIKGFMETINMDPDMPRETMKKFLNIIQVEAERLGRLIDDILSLSEIENEKIVVRENVNVSEAVKESVDFLAAKAQNKNIKLSENIKVVTTCVKGDKDRLKQMIINLIDNAIKYTNENGKVDIDVSKDKENCYISVSDNGIGIKPEDQRRLFERFYRVDKSRSRSLGGTGLGLAIVKHIANAMGGSVSVKSAIGEGSRFTMTLPLA